MTSTMMNGKKSRNDSSTDSLQHAESFWTEAQAKAQTGKLYNPAIYKDFARGDFLPQFQREAFMKATHSLVNVASGAFLAKVFGEPNLQIEDRKVMIGAGLSDVALLTLKSSQTQNVLVPPQVLVKVSQSNNDLSRAFAVQANCYQKEVNVYRHLSPLLDQIGFRIPKCYYSHAQGKEWFVLLLEAMVDGWVLQDQVKGMGRLEAELALEKLAQLHARFWQDEHTLDQPWLSGPVPGTHSILSFWQTFHPSYAINYLDMLQLCASGTANPLTKRTWMTLTKGPFITSPDCERRGGVQGNLCQVKEMFDFLAQPGVCMPLMDAMRDIIGTRPRTLVYGDGRGDNMFCRLDKDKAEICFIDFQLVNAGPPGFDLNQLLSGSVKHEVALEHHAMLSRYLQLLHSLNPTAQEYSLAMLYEDWRIGVLQFMVGVYAHGVATFRHKIDDRVARLWVYAFNRYGLCCAMLDCASFVKQLARRLGLDYPSGKKRAHL